MKRARQVRLLLSALYELARYEMAIRSRGSGRIPTRRVRCAVTTGRRLQCWGANDSGQLGFDPADAPSSGKPVDVPGLPAAASVAVGLRHACAIAAGTGDVWCWGANAARRSGNVVRSPIGA